MPLSDDDMRACRAAWAELTPEEQANARIFLNYDEKAGRSFFDGHDLAELLERGRWLCAFNEGMAVNP